MGCARSRPGEGVNIYRCPSSSRVQCIRPKRQKDSTIVFSRCRRPDEQRWVTASSISASGMPVLTCSCRLVSAARSTQNVRNTSNSTSPADQAGEVLGGGRCRCDELHHLLPSKLATTRQEFGPVDVTTGIAVIDAVEEAALQWGLAQCRLIGGSSSRLPAFAEDRPEDEDHGCGRDGHHHQNAHHHGEHPCGTPSTETHHRQITFQPSLRSHWLCYQFARGVCNESERSVRIR